jgi:hypothetical protein
VGMTIKKRIVKAIILKLIGNLILSKGCLRIILILQFKAIKKEGKIIIPITQKIESAGPLKFCNAIIKKIIGSPTKRILIGLDNVEFRIFFDSPIILPMVKISNRK